MMAKSEMTMEVKFNDAGIEILSGLSGLMKAISHEMKEIEMRLDAIEEKVNVMENGEEGMRGSE